MSLRWRGARVCSGAWVLAGALALSGCGVSRPMPLDLRKVVDTGLTTVSGQILVSRTLLQLGGVSGSLGEATVGDALVDAVDVDGKPLAQVAPTRSSAQGRFTLRDLRRDEPVFVRVTVQSALGQKPLSLLAYAKPGGTDTGSCLEVSLPSTMLAGALARRPALLPLVKPSKLPPLVETIRQDLRERLAEADGESLLEQLRSFQQQATPADSGRALSGALGAVVDSDALHDRLEQAYETFLDVTFQTKALGLNEAPIVLSGDRALTSPVDVFYRAPQGAFRAASLWLDNEKLAEGRYEGTQWTARFDPRRQSPGFHVLSMRAEPANESAAIVFAKVLVELRLEAPLEVSCPVIP